MLKLKEPSGTNSNSEIFIPPTLSSFSQAVTNHRVPCPDVRAVASPCALEFRHSRPAPAPQPPRARFPFDGLRQPSGGCGGWKGPPGRPTAPVAQLEASSRLQWSFALASGLASGVA